MCAQLAGNLAEHKRLLASLDSKADGRGYSTLGEVTEFVADVRARSERIRDAPDPRVAERVLISAFTNEDPRRQRALVVSEMAIHISTARLSTVMQASEQRLCSNPAQTYAQVVILTAQKPANRHKSDELGESL